MSISTIKKILLAGTALVAVSAFGAQAQATPTDTALASTTWAESATHTSASVVTAAAGDNLALGAGFTTTVTNDGMANDGSGLNTFNLGAVTGGAALDNLVVVAGSANDLTVNVGSFAKTVSVTADLINNTANPTAAVTVIDAGAWTSAASGTTLVNSDTTTAKAVSLTVGGNYQTALVTALTSGSFVGANTTLTLNGVTNSAVAVTLTDTAGGTGGISTLVLGGAAPQTFSATIAGGAAHEGVLTVSNTGGTALTGAISNLRTINAGAGAAGTVTSFSTTVGVDTENLTGLGTITNTGALTATTLNVNGAGLVNLNAGGANTIGTANFGADGTIALGTAAGTISGNVTTTTTNTGTLQLNAAGGTQTIGGTVGSSTLLLKEVDGGATGNVSSTFTGAVDATLLKVLGTGQVTLNAAGSNNIGTTNFAGDGLVTLITGGTLTGNVTTATTNTGTLTLAGTETLTGTVGTSTDVLKVVNIGAGNAGITNNVYATTVNVTGAGTVTFGGNVNATTLAYGANTGTVDIASGKNLTAAVTGAGAGTLALVGGTQTVLGAINDTALIVTAGAASASTTFASAITNAASITGGTGAITFGGAVTTSGNVVAANTTTVGSNLITDGGTFTLASGQTLNVSSAGGAQASGVLAAGAANVAAGSIIGLTTTAGPATVGGTKVYTLVSGVGGTISAAAADNLVVNGVADTAVGTTAFRTGAESYVETVAGDALVVTATRQATTATATANETSVATALNTIGASTGNLAAAITSYTSGSTTAANQVLGSLAPSVTGGAQNTALEVGTETQDVANVRMSALRDGDDKSGVAAGASANGVSLWLEGYGQHANQDAMDSVAGYSANTWGGVVGVDSTNLLDRSVLGVAFNYGHSKVDADDANNTHTGLDNYGVDLYGTYDLGNKMFVAGQAGYAYNKENTDRYNVGGLGVTASGDTHSDEWTARADLGRNYPMDGGLTLTPDVSANYGYLNTQGYSETGAGNADLNVNSNDQNVLALGVGGTATWKIKDDENIFKPSVHAGYAYNAINDKVQETSSFAAAPGVSFITDGASPARNVFDVGAKLVYETKANWDISATYDFQAKEDYTSHTGEVRATAHF
jgi:outer membrane autotransporter protein